MYGGTGVRRYGGTRKPWGRWNLAASFYVALSRERELHGESEVGGSCGITARREQRGVSLAVKEETHGEHLRQGVVSGEGEFERLVSVAC